MRFPVMLHEDGESMDWTTLSSTTSAGRSLINTAAVQVMMSESPLCGT